jgi:hypothetical protein
MQNADDEALLIARVRKAARAEIVGFLTACDGSWPAPLRCAALVRVWHALASLDALLAGEPTRNASEFAASFGHTDGRALPSALRDMTDDSAAVVFKCALSDPWVVVSAPTDREFDEHRRVLLRAFAELNRHVRRRLPARRVPWRKVAAVAIAVALPAVALLVLYRPRWRVSYYPNITLSGNPVRTTRVLEPDRNWGPVGPGGGVPNDHFSARYETCLVLKAPESAVFTVGSDDGARLFVDDRTVIDEWADHPYTTQQQSVELERGVHSLRLEYFQGGGDARLTFEGRVGKSASDVARMLHLPAGKGRPCDH